MQNYHCLLYREAEREMLPTCKVGTLLLKYPQTLTFPFCSSLVWVPSLGLLWLAVCFAVPELAGRKLYEESRIFGHRYCNPKNMPQMLLLIGW
jgi:hypothetical protein